jgi:branched-chain amino acid transport system permease protein
MNGLIPFFRGNAAAGAAILLILAVPLFGELVLTNAATRALILGLGALGLGLLVGFSGLISFGHAAFFGIGAYTVLLMNTNGHQEALVNWPMAAVSGALLAALLGTLCLRTRDAYFIMLTLAFAQMLYYFFAAFPLTGAEDGMTMLGRDRLAGFRIDKAVQYYYVVIAVIALVLTGLFFLLRGHFGRVLRAIKDNERRMRTSGYDVFRYQLAAFILSGAITGLSGGLAANYYLYVGPTGFHWLISGELLVMVILGGMATLLGPFFGAAMIVLAEAFLAPLTGEWRIFLGIAILLAVLFTRQGVYAWLRGLGGRHA